MRCQIERFSVIYISLTIYSCLLIQKPGDALAKFIQDREKWKDGSKHYGQSTCKPFHHNADDSVCSHLVAAYRDHSGSNGCGSNSSQHVETKRRRKTPPTTPGENSLGNFFI